MADTKISALNSLTGVNVVVSTDVLPIVDTSATETKKITIEQLRAALGLTQRSVSTNTTTTALDANGSIANTDTSPHVFSIDSNANVPYLAGTTLTFASGVTTLTIGIVSDSLTLAGTSTTGTRTLAANSIATAYKFGTTSWIISGAGLT